MELTINKRTFLRGLARTHGVADRKSSMPILSNILLSSDGKNKLRLAATDLYLGVSAVVDAEVSVEGSVAVAARTLFDIVKNLPDGEVEFRIGANHAAEIRCGKVRYRIPGMPGDDFPPLPSPGDVELVELDAEVLSDLITKTSFSMSSDDTRPHLAGAMFEGDAQIVRMVTTDGHRLSKAEYNLDGQSYGFSMLVPNKGIGELKRLVEDTKGEHKKSSNEGSASIGLASVSGNAFFRAGNVLLSVKLADEQFPPYSKVIPQGHSRRIVVGRGQMVEALRRISLVSNDKSGGIRLMIEAGILRIICENSDIGEGREELEVDFAGDPVTIGFNAKYLVDVLGALFEDEVALELSGELDPGVIRPVSDTMDFVGVVMPMRI